ncbi:hypothetical protein BBO99_00002663 [Phytophthora kernoviae]|uniref:Transmembrane protein 14C n=2 Tax=Phytophthora kernoviae TaxID=325452 RepID=A0A3R7JYH8_9STRA|nr:hypothetical protein G195_003810 [Phytophthora kernoviae 00238/432]KAG2527924.1 hypothetical protein JM16_002388 [Phytophthora kernoviae]KAG2529389.1 hypothetical protein JM18_002795 [Phytophthora kernoviae]RLN36671.1 hypothetical protein BBI17_002698 [Phytophthora kernoviae]RLN82709.1 hypothetical protein BBO99_00002663 [Phytophthora kernoviae]
MYDFCLTIPYGMTLGLGGLIGFVSSGSTTSLLAGGLSGAFLSFVGYCSYNEYTQSPVTSKLWPALSLAVSAPLTVVMGQRYQKTSAFFPAGIVAAYSAGMTLFYLWILTKTSKPQYKKKA